MSADWVPERVLQFIDLYEKEPVIWNPQHEYHKNRPKHNLAWERIQQGMDFPVTIEELKHKKNSLMPTFRQLIKRISQDPTFVSSWYPFEKMRGFLGPLYEKSDGAEGKPESSIDGSHQNEDSDEEEMDCNDRIDPLVSEISNVFEIDETKTDDVKPYIIVQKGLAIQVKKPKINEDNLQNNYSRTSSQNNHTPTPAKKIKLNNNGLTDTTDQTTRMEESANSHGTYPEDLDECDLFGKMVSTKLRKVTDEVDREMLMYEINMIVHKATMKSLKSREK